MTGRTFMPSDITMVRRMRTSGSTMDSMCRALHRFFTRDQVLEAVWATYRYQNDDQACRHANRVIDCQSIGIPMINGIPQAIGRGAKFYTPMFD